MKKKIITILIAIIIIAMITIISLKLTNKEVVNELGGLPSVKLHCSVLAEEAIKSAIADYYRKEGKLSEEEIIKKCNLKPEIKCYKM